MPLPKVSNERIHQLPTHFAQESQKVDAYWSAHLRRQGEQLIRVVDPTSRQTVSGPQAQIGEERAMLWNASAINGYAIAAKRWVSSAPSATFCSTTRAG